MREDRPLNVAGSIDDIWFQSKSKRVREERPLNVAGSIVLMFLKAREMLVDFAGSRLHWAAKFALKSVGFSFAFLLNKNFQFVNNLFGFNYLLLF